MFHRQPLCHNLLFALRPPPVLARKIAAAAGAVGRDVQRWDRLHVTLFILSGLTQVDPLLIEALRGIGAAIAVAPFEVSFDRMIGTDGYVALRPSRRNGDLIALHDRLTQLARTAGIVDGRLAFNPHISLIYRGGRVVNDHVAPVSWLADELLLIDSHVGVTRHELVDRWPLISEPDPQLLLL